MPGRATAVQRAEAGASSGLTFAAAFALHSFCALTVYIRALTRLAVLSKADEKVVVSD
jgi:hypothetical protein